MAETKVVAVELVTRIVVHAKVPVDYPDGDALILVKRKLDGGWLPSEVPEWQVDQAYEVDGPSQQAAVDFDFSQEAGG